MAGIGVIALIVGGRLFAARRVQQGRGWAIWLITAPLLLTGLVLVALGVNALFHGEIAIAVAVLTLGVPQSVGAFVMSRRAARGVTAAATPEARSDALLAEWGRYQVAITAFLLIGALVAVVVLIAVGVAIAVR